MSGCEWPVIWPDACAELDPVRVERTAAFVAMATDLLWNWTGRRFGVCAVTVDVVWDASVCACSGRYRPSTFEGRGPRGRCGLPWRPALVRGAWVNVTCGCGTACGCDVDGGVSLPGPVVAVESVTVAGTVLPESAWRTVGNLLLRVDGDPWEGPVRVAYQRGAPVPAGGQIAAGVLAFELSKAAECADDCQLPQRLQAVTRQGVSVAVMDQFEDLDDGRTGIWLVDSWVASVSRPNAGGSVLSPDLWCPPGPVRVRPVRS